MDDIINYDKNSQIDYYGILGCDSSATIDQIQTEYKVRAMKCHPDKNPGCEKATEEFAMLQRAKEILGDPTNRKLYDQWRTSGIAISFDNWLAKKDFVHASMHWRPPPRQQPMIDEEASAGGQSSSDRDKKEAIPNENNLAWRSEKTDILSKFRNYEI